MKRAFKFILMFVVGLLIFAGFLIFVESLGFPTIRKSPSKVIPNKNNYIPLPEDIWNKEKMNPKFSELIDGNLLIDKEQEKDIIIQDGVIIANNERKLRNYKKHIEVLTEEYLRRVPAHKTKYWDYIYEEEWEDSGLTYSEAFVETAIGYYISSSKILDKKLSVQYLEYSLGLSEELIFPKKSKISKIDQNHTKTILRRPLENDYTSYGMLPMGKITVDGEWLYKDKKWTKYKEIQRLGILRVYGMDRKVSEDYDWLHINFDNNWYWVPVAKSEVELYELLEKDK